MDVWTPRYRQVRTAYLLVALVLIAAYPVSPTWAQLTIKLAVSLATIPALLLGTRRISRNRRAPWVLLLAALTLINLANVVRLLPGDTATTVQELLDAMGNLIVLLAALQLIRQQGRANLGSIIDTSIVALAVGGLLWDLVLAPNLIASSQTRPAKLALFIVVFALSGVLGALAQMIIQQPVPALRPVTLALALALIADIIVAVTTDPPPTTAAAMMTIGAYTAVGLFGLDPTAAGTGHPSARATRPAIPAADSRSSVSRSPPYRSSSASNSSLEAVATACSSSPPAPASRPWSCSASANSPLNETAPKRPYATKQPTIR